jgi:hypothetical protein
MLERLAGSCSDGVTCPTVWADEETETVVVQGYVDPATDTLPPAPDGETRVRIPRSILLAAATRLR